MVLFIVPKEHGKCFFGLCFCEALIYGVSDGSGVIPMCERWIQATAALPLKARFPWTKEETWGTDVVSELVFNRNTPASA